MLFLDYRLIHSHSQTLPSGCQVIGPQYKDNYHASIDPSDTYFSLLIDYFIKEDAKLEVLLLRI